MQPGASTPPNLARRPPECPVCPGSRRLEALRHPEDISPFLLRWCAGCKGTWGSKGAIASGFSQQRGAHPALTVAGGPILCRKCGNAAGLDQACARCGWKRPPLACPECAIGMQPFEANGVIADTCASCGGLWLDGGEIARLFGPLEMPSLVALAAEPEDHDWEGDLRPSGVDVFFRFLELMFSGRG
ncbi:MAG: zf-TFIIB domain-containing protein [Dehalococcoidia bacterium]